LLLAGVMIVKDRLVGLFFGGLVGREKVLSLSHCEFCVSETPRTGSAVVEAARPLAGAEVVFTARFLRFLGRFPGVAGLLNSKKGADDFWSSDV